MAEQRDTSGFGTFQGVFRPTFLTILGAMLYLREGWLVGHTGLLGALLVVGASVAITGTTALSASSIATNQRVRPGGAFAIISQALGLEAGGAIGVPLYVAQALSSAMYAYAFAEAFSDTWGTLGGAPIPLVPIALVAFVAIAGLAWRSAALAFQAQSVMLWLVVAALVSLFAGALSTPLHTPTLLPAESGVGLVDGFAIFFPAATGIMVGVGMSGQLADPQRSIPRGTLGAWGVTAAIYLGAVLWYAVVATPQELMAPGTVAFDRAMFGWVVRAGLLTSTLMAALSSLVAASALLAAMADHGVIPGGAWVSGRSPEGEPRRATVLTMVVAALGLTTGSLDAIAPVITAFFILTYLALNSVVLLEQRLGMISFRPTFAIPDWVPALGVALCSAGLFLASPRLILLFGLVSVIGIYFGLARRELSTPWETVRSGINVAIADWAARRAARFGRSERSWKPDLVAPMTSPDQVPALGPLLEATAGRHGSVKVLAVGQDEELVESAHRVRERLLERGVFAASARVSADRFSTGFATALEAMQSDLFPPNLVVFDLTRFDEAVLREAHTHCRALELGLALYVPHPEGALGRRHLIDVWLSDQRRLDPLEMHTPNLDLPLLLGWLLRGAWHGELTLVTVVPPGEDLPAANAFLARVIKACRLGEDVGVVVSAGSFLEQLQTRRAADLHLFGMPPEIDRARMLEIADAAGGACLFLMDSGRESAFA